MIKNFHPPGSGIALKMSLSEIPPKDLALDLHATETERQALAQLNDLAAVTSLSAELKVGRWGADGVKINGVLNARVRQICVLSLEEFDTDIVSPIKLRLAPPKASDSAKPHSGDDLETYSFDAMSEDPPDPLVGEVVDFEAIISEFLTLALDPYPQKPGAKFIDPTHQETAAETSPFAQLLTKLPKKEEPD